MEEKVVLITGALSATELEQQKKFSKHEVRPAY